MYSDPDCTLKEYYQYLQNTGFTNECCNVRYELLTDTSFSRKSPVKEKHKIKKGLVTKIGDYHVGTVKEEEWYRKFRLDIKKKRSILRKNKRISYNLSRGIPMKPNRKKDYHTKHLHKFQTCSS